MVLRVEPMVEADLDDFIAISEKAFVVGIASRFYETEPDAESRASNVARYQKYLKTDPTMRLMKVVDDETGQIIAGAKWNVYATERTEEELKEATTLEIPPNGNKRTWTDFVGWLNDSRVRFMGVSPHVSM